MASPSLASEFPNDNTEISGGTIWICPELTGPATALLAPFEAIAAEPFEAVAAEPFEAVAAEPFVLFFDDEGDAYVDGPVELEVDVHGSLSVAIQAGEAEPALSAEPAPCAEQINEEAPAFAHFESALVKALLAQGATRSAALVPRLLRLESLPAEALTKDVQLTLQSRGYLDGSARYSAKYRNLCAAWSAVLHGASTDFAACGTTTLDRFGADLLAALLAVPATRADELRRELRKSGIAAFGVLAAA